MARLPEPSLRGVDNQTGLAVAQYDKMAPGRRFCDVLAVKASFDLSADGIGRSPLPGKICLADAHRNAQNPLGSSLVQAGDLILGKPGCDLYVTGNVQRSRPAPLWIVAVSVGPYERPLIQYQCAVSGPRSWLRGALSGWRLGESEATDTVPIQYELAYGGYRPDPKIPRADWEIFEANPCGSGYNFEGFVPGHTPAAPQWVAANPIGSMKFHGLVGLGPVARFWATRTQYAGTYDAAWKRQFADSAIPDYPHDFDMRFFHCAHPKLQTPMPLKGDEELHLFGFLKEKRSIHTQLPGWGVFAHWGHKKKKLPLDTIHIDLDLKQANLVWHLTLPQSMRVGWLHLSMERLNG
jgi:hypothetical protein